MNNNYEQLAQRTALIPTPELVARLRNPALLSFMAEKLLALHTAGVALDTVKAHVYYNKGPAPATSKIPEADDAGERIKNERLVKLLHGLLGKITEAAELSEILFRWLFGDGVLDEVHILEEIGDGEWFTVEALQALQTTLAQVQKLNIRKLEKRYPEKFTEVQAQIRDLEGERNALELGAKVRELGLQGE